MTLLCCGSDWAKVWTVEIHFLAKPWILPSSNTQYHFWGSLSLPLIVYLGYLPGIGWPERPSYDLSPSGIEVTNAFLVPREVEVVDPTQGNIYLTFSLNPYPANVENMVSS